MASPAYAWFYDETGNLIEGECKVSGREGSVEVMAFDYGVDMPTDKYTGTTTGTRQHNTASLIKAYDTTSPVMFAAACHGKTLEKVEVKWYRIDEQGKEQEYFTHTLEKVKVVKYQQHLRHTKDTKNDLHVHEDTVAFRFGKITMRHHHGNIEASDQWTQRS